jgi:hypothetical protein
MLTESLFDRDSFSQQHFESSEVRRILDEHTDSRADHSTRLWALLALETWHREMVRRPALAGVA